MSTPKQCVICHEFETKDRELTGSCDLPPDIHTMTDEEKKSVCRHVFHEECLDEWLKKRRHAPCVGILTITPTGTAQNVTMIEREKGGRTLLLLPPQHC